APRTGSGARRTGADRVVRPRRGESSRARSSDRGPRAATRAPPAPRASRTPFFLGSARLQPGSALFLHSSQVGDEEESGRSRPLPGYSTTEPSSGGRTSSKALSSVGNTNSVSLTSIGSPVSVVWFWIRSVTSGSKAV